MPTTSTTKNDRLMDPAEVAELLGTTTGTLSVWRCTRRYHLPYVRVGRRVRYRRADVENFIAERTVGAVEADA